MALTVLVQRLHFSVGHSGPLAFNIATEPPSVLDVETCERAYQEIIRRHGPISLLLQVRARGLKAVPREVRRRLEQMSRTLDASTIGHATVVEGEGLAAMLVRAFLTGVALLTTGTTAPFEVFDDVTEALDWLERLPGQTENFAEHRAHVEAEIKTRSRAASWVSA